MNNRYLLSTKQYINMSFISSGSFDQHTFVKVSLDNFFSEISSFQIRIKVVCIFEEIYLEGILSDQGFIVVLP